MISPSEWYNLCTKLFLQNQSLSSLGLISPLLVRRLICSKFGEFTDDSRFSRPLLLRFLFFCRAKHYFVPLVRSLGEDMRFFVVLYDSTPFKLVDLCEHLLLNYVKDEFRQRQRSGH